MLETVHLPHLPPDLPIYISLYRNLQNAPFLRQQLLSGNRDFEYAFIDASMVNPPSFQLRPTKSQSRKIKKFLPLEEHVTFCFLSKY